MTLLFSLCATLIVLTIQSTALAQNMSKPPDHKPKKVEFTVGGEITTETTISVPMNPRSHKQRCEADASVFFTQMDERVRVKTTIDPKECDAANGTYTIFMRIKDAAGETNLRQFDEEWEAQAGDTMESQKFYDMDDAIELRSLDLKRLRCTCLDEAPE